MIDIEKLRKDPDAYRHAIKTKRVPLELDQLLALDENRRDLSGEVDKLREQRNKLSDLVAAEPKRRDELIADSRTIGKTLTEREAQFREVDGEYNRLMALVPGLPCAGVPEGETDQDNVEIRKVGVIAKRHFKERDHLELATMHNMVDFEGARNAAGSRAYALMGEGVLLEMALMRLALDYLVTKGYVPVVPPLLVKEQAMFGTGYFPLGEDNAYELEKDNLYLTGTSEVGVVSMHANRTFQLSELPKRFVGISTCFRREAGSAGRDTKGLYRVHQFQKIEQVVFCENDHTVSEREHYLLLDNAETLLQMLELPYRVVAVCTGDMGLGQALKHDIETWMPSREAYCETHSCSSFFDFQSRRLGIRYRDEKQKNYVFTLNNTAIASPRILIPFLENHQNEDGSINIPTALRPYLGGRNILTMSDK
ncbi:MAG: serine--tRNA ligase [Candidatus Obscuribacterales bacterium]|nr:serine--tRNA ligase [Candidatus Obscuribacterales bacterium]